MRRGKAFQLPAPDTAGRGTISFITEAGKRKTLRPTPELVHEPIVRSRPSRRPSTHPLRRNTEGFYWFEQTGHHVWHESMVEYTALMLLDHSADIAGICTQPMRMDFDDGSAHFPDMFVVYGSGRQELCNVRPRSLIDDVARVQFRNAQAMCEQIGWTHRVIVDLPLVARHNLELLAAYRHRRNIPDDSVADYLLDVLDHLGGDATFGALWSAARCARDPYAVAGVYNLLWHRDIVFDLTAPLTMNTIIWEPEHA